MRLAAKVTAAVLVLDQITKYLVVHAMGLDQKQSIDVLPPWLNFRMAWNQGVNFGMFSGESGWTRWFLIVLALAISAWVWRWVSREAHSTLVQVSAGFLVGGAIGNVVDRVLYGAVADFLNMSTPWFDNPYSFNVADITIFLGAAGLVLFSGKDATAGDKARKS